LIKYIKRNRAVRIKRKLLNAKKKLVLGIESESI